jgi:hypothetical protein
MVSVRVTGAMIVQTTGIVRQFTGSVLLKCSFDELLVGQDRRDTG